MSEFEDFHVQRVLSNPTFFGLPTEAYTDLFEFTPPHTLDETYFESNLGIPLSSTSSHPQSPFHRRIKTCSCETYNLTRQDSKGSMDQRPVPHGLINIRAEDKTFTVHRARRSSFSIVIPNTEDEAFDTLMNDKMVVFNPVKLGFFPKTFWPNANFPFCDLVTEYFVHNVGPNFRFPLRLYNALRITDDDPFYIDFIGLMWVNEIIIKVYIPVLARFLNLRNPEESLFGQQGQFTLHGFEILTKSKVSSFCTEEDLEDVDFQNVRIIIHQGGLFRRQVKEEELLSYKWVTLQRKFSWIR